MKLALVMLSLLCVAVTSAQAATREAKMKAEKMTSMDAAWESGKIDGIYAELSNIQDGNRVELDGVQEWANTRYVRSYDRDPRMGLFLADTLVDIVRAYGTAEDKVYRAKTLTWGAQVFLSSQMIAFENVARCADKSVGGSYISLWLKGKSHGVYQNFLSGQSAELRSQVWEGAKKLADERNLSRADKKVCATGAEALSKMQLDPACKSAECDPVQFVELVKDTEWKARREQVQSVIRKRVEEGNI